MMAGRRFAAVSVLLMLIPNAVFCEGLNFTPASFGDDFSFLKNIEVPEKGESGEIRLYCFANVSNEGLIRRVYCRSDTKDVDIFSGEVVSRIRRARVIPARVGVLKVSVIFPFTVVASKLASGGTVSLFPHVFMNLKEYGLHYSAPQQYEQRGDWHRCGSDFIAWVDVVVDDQGVASKPRIFNGYGVGEDCLESLKDMAVDAKYIPAFSQDKPVSARNIRPFFSANRW